MKYKRHITWFIKGYEGYGIRSAIITFIEECKKQGYYISVISCYEGKLAEEIKNLNIMITVIQEKTPRRTKFKYKLSRIIFGFFETIFLSYKVNRILVKSRPEALHVVNNSIAITGMIATLNTGVLPIWEMSNVIGDNYLLNLNKVIYKYFIKLTSAIVLPNSKSTANSLQYKSDRITTLYLSVDLNKFNPNAKDLYKRNTFGFKDKDFIIGLFARFSVEKGQLSLLKALNILSTKYPNLKVLIIGGPLLEDYGKKLINFVTTNNLTNKSVILPEQKNIHKFYNLIDISVSLMSKPEGFGLSVVESMAMGKPVLAYRLGGPSETILENISGWFINSINVDEICNKIEEVYLSKNSLNKEEIRKYVLNNFSPQKRFENYESVLNRFL